MLAIGLVRRKRDSSPFLTLEHQKWVREINPLKSFRTWSGGRPLVGDKRDKEGQLQRLQLIESVWPGERDRLMAELKEYRGWATDDLHDAFAALWTARQIAEAPALAGAERPV